MYERLMGNFKTHAEAVKAGRYRFVYGPIKKPSAISISLYDVDTEAKPDEPGEELTIENAYNRYGGLMFDLPTFEVYGAVHADDPDDSLVVVIWHDGKDFWLAVRSDKLPQRYLFVGTRDKDEILPLTCKYLIRKPTHE